MSRILEWIFDGVRIHFQGAKLHALFFRPIDDKEKLATKAFFLQLVIKDFVKSVFNKAFPAYDNFEVAGGADIGNAIGTKNGSWNDRELLFLGACANYAAKIISTSGRLRLTKSLYGALPQTLKNCCDEIEVEGGDNVYQIKALKQSDLDDLLKTYKIEWDREKSRERIDEDKKNHPLKDIAYSSANTRIDLDSLSIWNNKRVLGASIFGDVAGFAGYIDSAKTDDEKKKALKVLHIIRKEMATVLKCDFNGLRIQFQGDRVQGLFHLPKDEEQDIAAEVVRAAVGLQSSMEKTVKTAMPDAKDLQLAVGIDLDTTLVSNLGARAHRDRICLGEPVENAAATEERCSGGQIGISERIYKALPEELSKHFAYDTKAKCYVANGLTQDKLDWASSASKAPSFISTGSSGIRISDRESEGARPIVPARSYAGED